MMFYTTAINGVFAFLIAGGLLRDKADVMAAMRAGAAAVSTSAPGLWDV